MHARWHLGACPCSLECHRLDPPPPAVGQSRVQRAAVQQSHHLWAVQRLGGSARRLRPPASWAHTPTPTITLIVIISCPCQHQHHNTHHCLVVPPLLVLVLFLLVVVLVVLLVVVVVI